ncbi:hypothetical protein BV22DRAFT_612102 [Leucogyrophana mollusca]|uniref:Uncharacterized protein n=1 Tax=Leucogyrophana mollusca TaxID=85980 RepID=A0ACB8BCK9_9AGAM|nr:hypothetical protein BV22DRAFT_612102 [Leucogyrophana mollusca]
MRSRSSVAMCRRGCRVGRVHIRKRRRYAMTQAGMSVIMTRAKCSGYVGGEAELKNRSLLQSESSECAGHSGGELAMDHEFESPTLCQFRPHCHQYLHPGPPKQEPQQKQAYPRKRSVACIRTRLHRWILFSSPSWPAAPCNPFEQRDQSVNQGPLSTSQLFCFASAWVIPHPGYWGTQG